MPVNKPLILPALLPPGTDLPGLLRSIADTELVSSAGLAVAVRTAADEIDRLRAALATRPQPPKSPSYYSINERLAWEAGYRAAVATVDAKARHLRLLRTRFMSPRSATPTGDNDE